MFCLRRRHRQPPRPHSVGPHRRRLRAQRRRRPLHAHLQGCRCLQRRHQQLPGKADLYDPILGLYWHY